MTKRAELLALARQLADEVTQSEEMRTYLLAEAALYTSDGSLALAPDAFSEEDQSPEMVEFLKARNNMEKLLHQLTSIVIRPLTGNLPNTKNRGCGGSGGCGKSKTSSSGGCSSCASH